MDSATDFLFAADNRINPALGGGDGQVAGVFLQGIIAILGMGRIGAFTFAKFLDLPVEGLRCDTNIF